MPMTNKKLHTILKQIARKTYGGSVEPFFVELDSKELKSRHGQYNSKNKTLRINNMSRDNSHVIVTAIHELAHHIEYTMFGKLAHDDKFYRIFKELLESAVLLGYVKYEKVRNIKDSTTISMMERKYGPVRVKYDESLDVNKDWRTVYVYNGYSVKETLKEKKYSFSAMEGIWEKDMKKKEAEEDVQELLKKDPSLDVQIKKVTDLSFDPVYQITLHGNTYPYKEQLKANGYSYKDKTWSKKIRKNMVRQEQGMIDSMLGVLAEIK